MISREEILNSPDYWFQNAQIDLYKQVNDYMKKEKINRTELSNRLHVSKGYVTQILNGEFNFTLKKLIDTSLAIGIVPQINYTPIEEIIKRDAIEPKIFHEYKAIGNMSSSNMQLAHFNIDMLRNKGEKFTTVKSVYNNG